MILRIVPIFLYICSTMQGFEKIEQILEIVLGSPKNGTDSPQQQYNCPCCTKENGGVPDGKYNLEVNVQYGVYQCWRCSDTHGTKGRLSSLIKKYGGSSLYKQYKEEMNALIKLNLYKLEDNSSYIEEIKETPILRLPKTFHKIDLSKYCKIPVREFLEKRQIDQETIDKFNIGYTEWEEEAKDWSYRIIIPSYDNNHNLNFFVGRDYTGNQKRSRYKNCEASKKDIIFQEYYVDWDAPIYICEGAIDCLRFPNTIALLGKHLESDYYLYQQLREKANSEIIICLDGDTEIAETKKIYSLLNYGRLKDKIKFLHLGDKDIPYKDFSEIYESLGKKGMMDAVRTSSQFSDFDLIY